MSEDPIGFAAGDVNLYRYVGNSPVNWVDPWGLDWLQNLSDFSAGFGDTLTFGITRWIRKQLGSDDIVNKCSDWYKGGEWTGVAYSIATGLIGGLRAAGTRAAGKEFSHWIPKRMGGPRSIWNGNYVTPAEHALSDPYRYRFMPRTWKSENPLPNVFKRQWNRLPKWIKGTGAGTAYGGASKSMND